MNDLLVYIKTGKEPEAPKRHKVKVGELYDYDLDDEVATLIVCKNNENIVLAVGSKKGGLVERGNWSHDDIENHLENTEGYYSLHNVRPSRYATLDEFLAEHPLTVGLLRIVLEAI